MSISNAPSLRMESDQAEVLRFEIHMYPWMLVVFESWFNKQIQRALMLRRIRGASEIVALGYHHQLLLKLSCGPH